MRLSFESLEARELMDACAIYGPMPLETADAALVAVVSAPEPLEAVAVDWAQVVGPLPEDVGKTSAARRVVSSDVVTVELTTGAPSAPSFLSFGDYSTDRRRLAMNWGEVDGAEGYVVHYSVDGGSSWRLAGYCVDKTSREALDVSPTVEYTYRVAAFNELGQSEWVAASWSYEDSLKPTAPGSISFDSYDASTRRLTYSWGFTGDAATVLYPCEYSYDGVVWKSAGNVKYNRNYRTASGVSEGATVYFRVCAQTVDGLRSDWVTAVWNGETA